MANFGSSKFPDKSRIMERSVAYLPIIEEILWSSVLDCTSRYRSNIWVRQLWWIEPRDGLVFIPRGSSLPALSRFRRCRHGTFATCSSSLEHNPVRKEIGTDLRVELYDCNLVVWCHFATQNQELKRWGSKISRRCQGQNTFLSFCDGSVLSFSSLAMRAS